MMEPGDNRSLRFGLWLLSRLVNRQVNYGLFGDLEEMYLLLCDKSRIKANLWLWTHLLITIPSILFDCFYWSFTMFKNYVKTVVRRLQRNKGYSFINIVGLAMGMACCILILLWVQDELSYDLFHEHAKHLYRVVEKNQYDTGVSFSAVTPAPVANVVKTEVPEVRNVARIWLENIPLEYGDKKSTLMGGLVDDSFLDMFTFPLNKGDAETALSDMNTILLTEESAVRLFGNEDPLGKSLKALDGYTITVTGILKDIPNNSHLRFDFLIPLQLATQFGISLENWAHSRYFTYVQLHENASPEEAKIKIRALEQRNAPGGSNSELQLQPIKDIYLHSLNGGGAITYVYVFSIVALFSLIIACINFINLTTAWAAKRAKEVGLKKVMGAHRWQLVRQLMGETVVFTMMALVVAVLLVYFILPVFNEFSGKHLALSLLHDASLINGLIGISVITGLIAGSYPALYLSAFQPVQTLRSTLSRGIRGSKSFLRKGLVVFQFVISIALIVCTAVVYSQLYYMSHKDLGIDVENIVCVPVDDLSTDYETMKHEFLQSPHILHVTAISNPPMPTFLGTSAAIWEGKREGQRISMGLAMVDYDCIETFRMEIVEGRGFSREFSTDATEAYIVNETAVRAMGMESPIGKKFSWNQRDGKIIGVVKNFHSQSLRWEIRSFVLLISPAWYNYLCIKVSADKTSEALVFIKDKWSQLRPNQELTYSFLDTRIDGLYRAEHRMGSVLQYFAFLAIFISCLGLFGLAAFVAEQRTKEIGIRKVLGSSVSTIVFLLAKEFLKWVFIANIVAWPLAWYAMNRWLQNFAYRTGISPWILISSGVLAMIIAVLTVSYQSIKAALANPVESLRYE